MAANDSPKPHRDLDRADRLLINTLQTGFPIVPRPFQAVAEALGLDPLDVIARLQRMVQDGTLTRFGGVLSAPKLGGERTLAAIQVPAGRFDQVATIVNAMPAVSHNYERQHALNMWFVISSETKTDIDETLRAVERETGLTVYNMPTLQEFFVEIVFRLPLDREDESLAHGAFQRAPPVEPAGPLSDRERDVLLAIQDALPLNERPFRSVAEAIGTDESGVIETVRSLLAQGKLKRLGAVPDHYALGFTANGMSVWDVPDQSLAEIGPRLGACPEVTHCYERPRHPGVWPYSLFAMVHGSDRDAVRGAVDRIADQLGIADIPRDILFSTRILKKRGAKVKARVP